MDSLVKKVGQSAAIGEVGLSRFSLNVFKFVIITLTGHFTANPLEELFDGFFDRTSPVWAKRGNSVC
jgi:hypothetical protein